MSTSEEAVKYDNLRLCNDYIADMEGTLTQVADALCSARAPEVLVATARRTMLTLGEAIERATRLEAERDALREDAARWLWWREQWCDPDSEAIGEHDIGDCADAESLDAAIDVQIAKSHPN